MQSGFTIDEKNRLVFLRVSDGFNQTTAEADERTITANRVAYEEFVERTASAGAPIDKLPERVRKDVQAMRSGGLKKKEDARHAAEVSRIRKESNIDHRVTRELKRAKAAKPKRKAKKGRRR